METRHHGTSCCPFLTSPLAYSPQNIIKQIMSPGNSPSTLSMCFVFGGSSSHFKPKTPIYPTGLYRHMQTIHKAREESDNFGKTPVIFLFVCLFPIKVSQSEGPLKSVVFRRFDQSTGEWVKMTFFINKAKGVIQ